MKNESKDAAELHAKRAFSYELIEKTHNKFVDQKTGRFYPQYVAHRVCPVCEADEPLKIFDKSGGTYVKCKKCTMVYTDPGFTEDALTEYYKQLDTKQGEIVAGESDFYNEIYSLGLTAVEATRPKGKLLDMGCSTGFFLDIAKKRGWDTYGIELGEIEAKECKAKGHRVYTELLENIQFDIAFDAITLWDVFEHILDGKKYLNLFSKILSPDGVLFFQIPNSGGLAPKILRDECNMFDGIEHVCLYNPKTITMIAESCGFEVVTLRTVISEIAVMNSYLSYDHPYFGKTDFDNKAGLLGVLNDSFIHENLLGYKIQIVLKKKR